MCVREDYNDVWQYGTIFTINKFMDKCEDYCIKYGNCDYYGWLDDKLKELNS